MKMVAQLLILSLMISVVGACGSDTSASDANVAADETQVTHPEAVDTNIRSSSGRGKAEFTFTGGINETFTGQAMHMIQETSVGDIFQLAIYSYRDENNFTAISVVNMNGTAELGQFTLTDESDYKVGFVQKVAGVMSVGGIESGMLALAASGTSGLSGTLSFSGGLVTGPGSKNGKPVTGEATFEAAAGMIDHLPKGLGAPE